MVSINNPMAAASAYSNAAKTATGSGETDTTSSSSGGAAGAAGGGGSFGKMLEGAVKSSMDTIHAGEAASASAITGKASLLDVTQAISAAKLTLETTVAVRDNVLEAYNKIMQMPI